MGAVFALGFILFVIILLLVIMAVGFCILSTGGTVSLISTFRKKRSSSDEGKQRKRRRDQIIGINITAIGVFAFIVPLIILVAFAVFIVSTVIQTGKSQRYFYSTVSTNTVLEETSDQLWDKGFDYEGNYYTRVFKMKLQVGDPNRKGVYANTSGDPITVYHYESKSGCSMFSMGDKLFCREDQIDQLEEYYHKGKFKYRIETQDEEDRNLMNKRELKFSGELFLGIYDRDSRIVEKCGNDYLDYFEQHDVNFVDHFELFQVSEDKMLTRIFEVHFTDVGDIYISHVSKVAGKDFRTKEVYLVTNKSAKKVLQNTLIYARSKD